MNTPDAVADALIDFDTLGGGIQGTPSTPEPAPGDDDFLKDFDPNPPAAPAPETGPETPKPDAGEPAAPETPKPEDADPKGEEDDIEQVKEPAKASPAAKESFSKIKTLAKTYKEKLAETERLRAEEVKARDAELETLRRKVGEIPELAEKAKLVEEAERELAISRVEGSREFKQVIEAPLRVIEDALEAIAKANDVRADDIWDIVLDNDPAKARDSLRALLTSIDEVDRVEIPGMIRDARALLTKRDEMRSRAVEARKELEERTRDEETRAQQKARESFEAATEHATAELQKRVPFIPLVDGETAEAVFAGILEKAKSTDLDKAPVGNKAFAAVAAVMLKRVTSQVVHLQNENKTLKARIAEGNAARPTVGSVTPDAGEIGGDDFLADIAGALGQSGPINVLDRLSR